jgi:hypothetical protein
MRGWVRVAIVAALVGTSAAALAVVSGGRAGSVPGADFEFFLHPEVLSSSGTGFAVAKFTLLSGSGTGSATHVVIRIDLDTALLNPTATSSDCTGPVVVGSNNRFTCNIGTVDSGETVKRFVTFTASALGMHSGRGTASLDSGSSAGGGGGTNTVGPVTDQLSVVSATSDTRAGNCYAGRSSFAVFTAPVSAENIQRTTVRFGPATASLPCTWAFVGEDSVPGFRTQISFVSVPELNVPAIITVDWYSLPVAFPEFRNTLRLLPSYPPSLESEFLVDCVDGELPEGEIACLLDLVRVRKGARATILQLGTEGDPGYGGG